jgi:hypothetical protein
MNLNSGPSLRLNRRPSHFSSLQLQEFAQLALLAGGKTAYFNIVTQTF